MLFETNCTAAAAVLNNNGEHLHSTGANEYVQSCVHVAPHLML
jgi:hypothetical protein